MQDTSARRRGRLVKRKWTAIIGDAIRDGFGQIGIGARDRYTTGLSSIVLERDVGGTLALLHLRDPSGTKLGLCELTAPIPWMWPLHDRLIYGTFDHDLGDLIVGDPAFDEFFQIVTEEPLGLFHVLFRERRLALLSLVRELRRESKRLQLVVGGGKVHATFYMEDKRKLSPHAVFTALTQFMQPAHGTFSDRWSCLLDILTDPRESEGFKDAILGALALERAPVPDSFRGWLEGSMSPETELSAALHGFFPAGRTFHVIRTHAMAGHEHPRFRQMVSYFAKSYPAKATFDEELPLELRIEVLKMAWQQRVEKTPGLERMFLTLLDSNERLCAALVQCIRESLTARLQLPGENLREVLFSALPELQKRGGKFLRREIVDVLCAHGEAEDTASMLAVLEQRVDDNNALQIVQRLGEVGNLSALSRLEQLSIQEQLGPVSEAAGRAHAAIRARHAGATGGGLTLAEPGAGEEGRLTLVAGNQGGISLVKEDEEP